MNFKQWAAPGAAMVLAWHGLQAGAVPGGEANVKGALPVPMFQDGERVCFVGDSITHGGGYHSFVYLYYLTRYPAREIRIWNKGISGDQTYHVLQRFDQIKNLCLNGNVETGCRLIKQQQTG